MKCCKRMSTEWGDVVFEDPRRLATVFGINANGVFIGGMKFCPWCGAHYPDFLHERKPDK